MNLLLDARPYVACLATSPLARWSGLPPWELTAQAPQVVRLLLGDLPPGEFSVCDEVAVHRSARVEPGAVLKGPLILGAGCFVAAGAYLRGGNWLDRDCVLGPGVELKSSFVFAGTHLAHFNFVGDSLLGAGVNFEAGAIVCNHRNERVDKEVRVRVGTALQGTGRDKFGALVGDECRIGANAVLAPGTLLLPGAVVGRLGLCDHDSGLAGDRAAEPALR